MDVGGETIFPMPANHTDICRFSDAKDQMYQNVAGILLKICDNVCYEPCMSLKKGSLVYGLTSSHSSKRIRESPHKIIQRS